jgi:preprotein translocase subunit SecD
MMMKQFLWSVAAISALNMACTHQLKDYTQVTLQASAIDGSPTFSADSLDKTQAVLTSRLSGLGITAAEIETLAPNQIVVRLPMSVDAKSTELILTNPGQLHLRNQKPNTAAQLTGHIEDLQRLLVEQNTLAQTGKKTEAEALQVQIDKTRGAIAALFEPSPPAGETLSYAQAQPSPESADIWEIKIQFDEPGAQRFAAQTKSMAGTDRAIGLFLDEVLLSAPTVDKTYALNGITDGAAVIAGNFTPVAAKELEVQLRSGGLPVTLTTVAVTSTAEPDPTEPR